MSFAPLAALAGAFAVDPGNSEESRRRAARVRTAILSKRWEELFPPDTKITEAEVIVQGLSKWLLASPSLDAMSERLETFLQTWQTFVSFYWGGKDAAERKIWSFDQLFFRFDRDAASGIPMLPVFGIETLTEVHRETAQILNMTPHYFVWSFDLSDPTTTRWLLANTSGKDLQIAIETIDRGLYDRARRKVELNLGIRGR